MSAESLVAKSQYQIVPCATAEDLLIARNTVRGWIDIQSDRLAISRQNKGTSEAAFQAFKEDKDTFDKYSTVLSYISDSIVRQRNQITQEALEPSRVTLLRDGRSNVQGILGVTIKSDQVYIDGLASAPWNIPMNASAGSYLSRVFKGAGKALMAYAYKQTQQLNKPVLCTTPLASAFSFYQGIQMEFDQKSCLFSYRIGEAPPQALKPYYEDEKKTQS